MVWQREIIENLLAGRSVDSNFGINTFRADSTKASGLNEVLFRDSILRKKVVPIQA